ncbi:hypothetical protein VCRA2126E132_440005 [Vibrio crassostreae]|nr:hypothetical protein VCRA2126E132_440005 [Vibrio crassostreae]
MIIDSVIKFWNVPVCADSYVEFTPVIQHGGWLPPAALVLLSLRRPHLLSVSTEKRSFSTLK